MSIVIFAFARLIIGQHLKVEQKAELKALPMEFSDVFSGQARADRFNCVQTDS